MMLLKNFRHIAFEFDIVLELIHAKQSKVLNFQNFERLISLRHDHDADGLQAFERHAVLLL